MKLMRRITRKITTAVLAAALMLTPMTQVVAKEVQKETTQAIQASEKTEVVRLQDDFYEAINKEWIKNAKIEPGYTEASTMMDLNRQSSENVKAIFNGILKKEAEYKDTDTEKKMINLYKNVLNWEERNKQGVEPIKKYLEQIDKVQTIEEFSKVLRDKDINMLNSLMGMGISPDIKDSTHYALYIGSTSLQLGDVDNYTIPSTMATTMKQAVDEYNQKVLELAGYSKEEATQMITNIYKFEDLIIPSMMGTKAITTHPNYYEASYNVYTVEQLEKAAPNLELRELLKANGVEDANKIIVSEPKWLEALNVAYTQENLPLLKDYLKLNIIKSTAGCLSQDFEEASKGLQVKLMGISGEVSDEEKAFQTVNAVFSNALGKLYVEKHFSPEAKKDVEEIVKEIIDKYEERINKVEWMSDTTKVKAIEKLKAIKVKIGYPDTWGDYSGLEIKSFEEGSSLLESVISLAQFSQQNQVAVLNQPVDKEIFGIPPQMVNAFYNPSNNEIVFPAGILQAPYYDVNQSREENMGGIGAVIGHEISHAFDNTGARFDKEGNLKDWWTPEDYKVFEEKAQAYRDYFSSVEVAPGQFVNGDLTVGENIADIGSIACIIDILDDDADTDFKEFFNNWAVIWRGIQNPEYAAFALTTDPHSPGKVRVNEVVKQFEQFYETYGITEEDEMYLEPEKRLSIW